MGLGTWSRTQKAKKTWRDLRMVSALRCPWQSCLLLKLHLRWVGAPPSAQTIQLLVSRMRTNLNLMTLAVLWDRSLPLQSEWCFVVNTAVLGMGEGEGKVILYM